MKKILLFLYVIISLQTLTAQNVVYGVKGGLNYTSFHGSNEFTRLLESEDLEYKYSIGFNVGVFIMIDMNNNFYLQPELVISSQGSKQNIENVQLIDQSGNLITNSLDVRFDTNLLYINIPIMGKYYFDERFNIEFGPQLGYMLSGKIKRKVTDSGGLSDEVLQSLNTERNEDIENTNDIDFGLSAGFGYDITNDLGVGIRYNYGLTENFRNGSPLKNSVFQLSFEYRFN